MPDVREPLTESGDSIPESEPLISGRKMEVWKYRHRLLLFSPYKALQCLMLHEFWKQLSYGWRFPGSDSNASDFLRRHISWQWEIDVYKRQADD